MSAAKRVVQRVEQVPGVLMAVVFARGAIRVQTVVNGRPRTYTIIDKESQ